MNMPQNEKPTMMLGTLDFTLDELIELFEKVMGRKPTEEEIARVWETRLEDDIGHAGRMNQPLLGRTNIAFSIHEGDESMNSAGHGQVPVSEVDHDLSIENESQSGQVFR
jgi:hypothetical protein